MKLLIITQKIDVNDDLLGFMHGWVREFAKHFESIIVITLGVGEYHLPDNVRVLSLGKENLEVGVWNLGFFKKLKYGFIFFSYIWRYRNEYDGVLVHMNKEYMALGGLFWRLWGKKAALWYNHGAGNIISVLAGCLAQKIFCTSPFSFFAKWSKTSLMPAGIDTEIFRQNENIQSVKKSILFLSRLSPIKGAHILIKAANLLDRESVNFLLNIVGEAGEKDKEYFEKLKDSAKELEQKGKIKFWGKIANYKTPEIYNQNEIVVNLTNSGSFDKIILEAMACEKPILVCNKSFLEILPDNLSQVLFFEEGNAADLKNKLTAFLNEPQKTAAGKQLRAIVQKKHSLVFLSQKLFDFFCSD